MNDKPGLPRGQRGGRALHVGSNRRGEIIVPMLATTCPTGVESPVPEHEEPPPLWSAERGHEPDKEAAVSVHESPDGDDTTTSGGVSEPDPADVVVSDGDAVVAVAALLYFARADQRCHASCGTCYAPDGLGQGGFYLGVCGLPAVVWATGDVEVDPTTGVPLNACQMCAARSTCAVCSSRLDWA